MVTEKNNKNKNIVVMDSETKKVRIGRLEQVLEGTSYKIGVPYIAGPLIDILAAYDTRLPGPPPCKIGDTVYHPIFNDGKWEIESLILTNLLVTDKGKWGTYALKYSAFMVFEKDIFITREEAQASIDANKKDARDRG